VLTSSGIYDGSPRAGKRPIALGRERRERLSVLAPENRFSQWSFGYPRRAQVKRAQRGFFEAGDLGTDFADRYVA